VTQCRRDCHRPEAHHGRTILWVRPSS
jgi:hypothetical protein